MADKQPWFNREAFALAGEMSTIGHARAHPLVAELVGPPRWVFLAVASFSALHATDPVCFASHAEIAKRAGVTDRTVRRALLELAKLGVLAHGGQRITRAADGKAGPVKWRQIVLSQGMRGRSSPDRESGLAEPSPVRESDERPDRESDDPRNPCDPKGAKDEEEDASASRGASACAAAPPAASAAGPSADTLADLARRDGASLEHTQRWAEFMLADRTVDKPDRYLLGCLRRGDGPATWTPPRPKAAPKPSAPRGSAKTKGKDSAKKTKGKAAPVTGADMRREAARTEHHSERYGLVKTIGSVRAAIQEDVARRVLAGEDAEAIAADLGRGPAMVQGWVSAWLQKAAGLVVGGSSTVESAAEQMSIPVAEVEKAVAEERERRRVRQELIAAQEKMQAERAEAKRVADEKAAAEKAVRLAEEKRRRDEKAAVYAAEKAAKEAALAEKEAALRVAIAKKVIRGRREFPRLYSPGYDMYGIDDFRKELGRYVSAAEVEQWVREFEEAEQAERAAREEAERERQATEAEYRLPAVRRLYDGESDQSIAWDLGLPSLLITEWRNRIYEMQTCNECQYPEPGQQCPKCGLLLAENAWSA